MAKYKLTEHGVYDNEEKHFIPNNSENSHWVKYQEWLENSNTPDPLKTEEELIEDDLIEVSNLEELIVNMRLRKDCAELEGLTSYANKCNTELIKLRNQLSSKKKLLKGTPKVSDRSIDIAKNMI